MSENISKRSELLIISDTAVYRDPEGNTVAFEPVVREIENIAHLFGSITWLAFQYPYLTKIDNVRAVKNVEIEYVLIPATGGKGLYQKLRIVLTYIRLFFIVPHYVNSADVIHTRGPSHPAVVAIIYSIIAYRKKKFWHKYAGNWIRKNDPFSYKINKYLLGKACRTKVTINGRWPDQLGHMVSLENPCLTEQERIEGHKVLQAKNYDGILDFVFVGQLTESKGVGRIIEAFRQLNDVARVGILHIVGDGMERAKYEKVALEAGIKCRFYGYLSRTDIIEILSKASILLLPSDSEGFPKVVAEGANYGCIPVVSDVSCLSQYIENQRNGYLIKNSRTLFEIIIEIVGTDNRTLSEIAAEAFKMGLKFTYTNYIQRLHDEILS